MIDLEAIKKQLESISKWPWRRGGATHNSVISMTSAWIVTCNGSHPQTIDATFIAKAPETISQLVAEVERLQKLIPLGTQTLVDTYQERTDLLQQEREENEKLRAEVERLRKELEGRWE